MLKEAPPRPGEALAKTISGHRLTHVADCLCVNVSTLQRVIRGDFRVTPAMAYRLSIALETPMEYWLRIQTERDVWDMQHDKNRPTNVKSIYEPEASDIPEQETLPFDWGEE